MPKYMFSRASIVEELFTVQAKSEQEALEMVMDGHPAVEIERGSWMDWYHDNYELIDVEDKLVTFVKGEAVNG
jgi:hypothetical protein